MRRDRELARGSSAAKAGFGDDLFGFVVKLTKRITKHRQGLAGDVFEPALAAGDFPRFTLPVELGKVGMRERVRTDFVPRRERSNRRFRQPPLAMSPGKIERAAQAVSVEHIGDAFVEDVAVIPACRYDHRITGLRAPRHSLEFKGAAQLAVKS
jgi:hypothetical protein